MLRLHGKNRHVAPKSSLSRLSQSRQKIPPQYQSSSRWNFLGIRHDPQPLKIFTLLPLLFGKTFCLLQMPLPLVQVYPINRLLFWLLCSCINGIGLHDGKDGEKICGCRGFIGLDIRKQVPIKPEENNWSD